MDALPVEQLYPHSSRYQVGKEGQDVGLPDRFRQAEKLYKLRWSFHEGIDMPCYWFTEGNSSISVCCVSESTFSVTDRLFLEQAVAGFRTDCQPQVEIVFKSSRLLQICASIHCPQLYFQTLQDLIHFYCQHEQKTLQFLTEAIKRQMSERSTIVDNQIARENGLPDNTEMHGLKWPGSDGKTMSFFYWDIEGSSEMNLCCVTKKSYPSRSVRELEEAATTLLRESHQKVKVTFASSSSLIISTAIRSLHLHSKIFEDLHSLHQQYVLKLKQLLSTHPDTPNEATGDTIERHLKKTGYQNIKKSHSGGVWWVLVITRVDDEDLPLPAQSFPIRFELRDTSLLLRLFFSVNNAVGVFRGNDVTVTEELLRKLTDAIGKDNCKYEYASGRSQVHLVWRGKEDWQNYEVFNQQYLSAITDFKWTAAALYEHYCFPQKSALNCYEKIVSLNPMNPTSASITLFLPTHIYEDLTSFLNKEKVAFYFHEEEKTDQERKITQSIPLEYIEIRQFAEENLSDLWEILERAQELIEKGSQAGLCLSLDFIMISKLTRKLCIRLPETGLTADMEANTKANLALYSEILTSTARIDRNLLHLKISNADFRLTCSISEWEKQGQLCNQNVLLVYCSSSVLFDPLFPLYLTSLYQCEYSEEVLGLMDYEEETYVVIRWNGSVRLTKQRILEVLDFLEFAHTRGHFHGCLCLLTLNNFSSNHVFLILPCISPDFFPLVARILDPVRLNYQLYPPLQPNVTYGVAPSAEDLIASDVFGLYTLVAQFCLREAGSVEGIAGLHCMASANSLRLGDIRQVLAG